MVKPITKAIFEAACDTGFLDCKDLHDGSCEGSGARRFLKVMRGTYKYYIPFHLIPLLLFKMKRLKKAPRETILKALWFYVRSILFMASFNAVLKYFQCWMKSRVGRYTVVGPALGAFISAWTCFLETESRRTEICLFIMPRFLETFWAYLKHRKYVTTVWGGENMLFGLAMGTIAYYFHKKPEALKETYIGVFKRFFGVAN
jgi:hypothetical protein